MGMILLLHTSTKAEWGGGVVVGRLSDDTGSRSRQALREKHRVSPLSMMLFRPQEYLPIYNVGCAINRDNDGLESLNGQEDKIRGQSSQKTRGQDSSTRAQRRKAGPLCPASLGPLSMPSCPDPGHGGKNQEASSC